MLEGLQRSVRERAAGLRLEFAAAKPFRHVVIDDFLESAYCERLIEEFPAFDVRNAVNELGETGRKAVVRDLPRISPSYREFDRLVRSREFLRWLGDLTSIEGLLYDPDYIGGGTHENLSGQDLDWHVDFNYHPTRLLHRRLNLILFLNPTWEPEWGGCLELGADPWRVQGDGELQCILPLANRCVVFETTERSWHGFRRICLPEGGPVCSRRSIAVYFYTKNRPAGETAPGHGTIYVPRSLPDRIGPGYTLAGEDMEELQILLARRDQQIRHLYGRELEFSTVLTGVYRSLSFRVGRALTWPLRRLLKRNRISG